MQTSPLASTVKYASNSNLGAAADYAGPAGVSGGYSIAVLPTIASFFSSLSPRYSPKYSHQSPSAQVAGDGQVPGEKSWTDTANDFSGKVKLVCNLASCWVPQLQVPCEAVAALCSSLTLANDLGSVLEQKEDNKRTATSRSGAPVAACAGAVTLTALDSLTCAAAVPAPGERGSPQQPIEVPDSETLARIGRDGSYPADACYRQTDSFSHNHTEPGVVFQGDYQGGCHTISDLKSCLFSKLDRYATVRDLRLADARIEGTATRQSGALACEMSSYSSARNIEAENVSVHTRAVGDAFEPVAVGVITGHQRRAAEVSGVQLHQCHVAASDENSAVGLVAGLASGELKNINITESDARASSPDSPTGLGVGDLRSTIDNMRVSKGYVVTFSKNAPAGIGAGVVRRDGQVSRLAVFNSRSNALGSHSASGIVAGKTEEGGQLRELTMVECRAKTAHTDAPASIGTSSLGGEIKGMVSIRSNVFTLSPDANAAIGAGDNMGQIDGLTTVNGTVRARHGRTGLASARGAGSAHATMSFNTRIGRETPGNERLPDLSQLCARGDARFLTTDCQIVQAPMAVSPWSCPSNDLHTTRGSRWQPIEIGDIATLNSIGLSDHLPADAHYIQTENLNGALLDRNTPLIFSGHYDGQNHIIDGLTTCLFDELQGTVRNLKLTNTEVVADGRPAGVLTCQMSGTSGVENIQVNNSRVVTWGAVAPAGMISGRQQSDFSQVNDIEIGNSTLETFGKLSCAGMVAGECLGDAERVAVHHSQVRTNGVGSSCGLAGGFVEGLFRHFTATCSQVEAQSSGSSVGGFAGRISGGRFGPATLVRTTVASTGQVVNVGVGAGHVYAGWLKDITAMECQVRTLGREASTGIGAGRIGTRGSLHNINVIRSNLVAEGDHASAGICAGVSGNSMQISGCTLRNSSLHTLGDGSRASPVVVTSSERLNYAELSDVTIYNTRVNGRPYHIGTDNMTIGTMSCQTVDPRFVQPDCQGRLAPNCPLPPVNITALALVTPAAATGISVATMVGLVAVGSALVVGASVLGTCVYNLCRQARETLAQDEGIDYPQPYIEERGQEDAGSD